MTMKERRLSKSPMWRLFKDQEEWLKKASKIKGLRAAIYLRILLDAIIGKPK